MSHSESNHSGEPKPAADLTLGGLAIVGPDAAGFLQGYLTHDVEASAADSAQPTALTTLKGRVLANGWALREQDRVLLVIEAGLVLGVAEFLRKYLAFSKSTAEPVDDVSAELGGVELPGPIDPRQPLNPQLIAARLALVSTATSDEFLPQMLGLVDQGAVNFDKGCYLGQEVVARAQHRGAVKRRLQRISGTRGAAELAAGTDVTAGDARRVGTVIVSQQQGDKLQGLAVLNVAADAHATLAAADWALEVV
ncbi:MAG: hypothetical protein AAF648_02540 [Pseudomonadota bacterium]